MTIRTRLIASAVAATALGLGLTACGSSQPDPGNGISALASTAPAADATFLIAVHSAALDSHGTDAQLLTIGHDLCESLGAGTTWTGVIRIMLTNGNWTGYDAGEFTALTVANLCPQYLNKLPSSSNG